MLVAVVWLLLGEFVTGSVESCPNGYTCQWERSVFVLHCKPVDDKHQSEMVAGIITNIPVNTTRLKVYCHSQHICVSLAFANLSNIRELSLDNLNLSTMGRHVFHGVAYLTHLVLHTVYLKRFDVDLFAGLTKLRSLTIEHLNDIDHLEPNMLKPLVSLQTLSFRHVSSRRETLFYSNFSQVVAGIESSTLHTLVLYAIHSKYNPETELNIDDMFRNNSVGLTLKRLDLGRNNIAYIRGLPLITLPMLEYISLDENAIVGANGSLSFSMFWMQLLAHPRLKMLSINGMNRLAAPTTSDVFFSFNANKDCRRSIPIRFGQQFEAISLRNTAFLSDSFIRNFQFCFIDKNRSLKYVDITNVRCTKSMRGSIGHVHTLEYFIFQNANVHRIETDIFQEMPNLTVLLMGKNDIGGAIANDAKARLFSSNYKLRVLDLSGCNLTEIPRMEFSNLHKLQNLNLSGNTLRNFHVQLDTLRDLQMLNLNRNELITLRPSTRTQLDSIAAEKQLQVDISENPLQCRCSNTEFVTWVHTTRVTFLNQDNTFCVDGNNSLQLLFRVDSEALKTACPQMDPKDSNFDNALLAILVPTLIILAVASGLVYIYQWKCVYCWTCATEQTTGSDVNHADVELDPVIYERDAFICYNSNDSAWVCNDLLEHLDDNRISTVIHQRDFLPGSVLEDMIRESIAKCRYTVLVLSPDFLSSNWCLLEMQLACSRISSQGRGGIVPIILREFPMSQLTTTLYDILSKSYLKWTDNPQGQVLFWDKLVTKLRQGGNLRPLEIQRMFE